METFEKWRETHTSVRKVDAMIKTFSCPPFNTEKNHNNKYCIYVWQGKEKYNFITACDTNGVFTLFNYYYYLSYEQKTALEVRLMNITLFAFDFASRIWNRHKVRQMQGMNLSKNYASDTVVYNPINSICLSI